MSASDIRDNITNIVKQFNYQNMITADLIKLVKKAELVQQYESSKLRRFLFQLKNMFNTNENLTESEK